MDFEKYIDRLDQDRRDMEQRLREDRQAMEQRITEERRLSEERLEGRMANINQRFDRMEQKLDTLAADVYKEGKTTRNWVMGISLTTILGIVAIVVAVFLK